MRTSTTIIAVTCLLVCAHPALADAPAIAPTDISAMKDVTLKPVDWAVAPGNDDPKLSDQPLQLPADNMGRRPVRAGRDFIVPSGRSLLAFQSPEREKPTDKTQAAAWDLVLVDLTKGASRQAIHLPGGFTAKAVSPDGAVAMLSAADPRDPRASEVDLIDLKETTPAVRLAFIPYEGEDAHARHVEWARLLDAEHLLTLNDGGGREQKLVLWQISAQSVKGIWSLKVPRHFGGDPILTPDCRYAVCSDITGTYFLETATGKVAGSMCDSTSGSWFVNAGLRFAVSPDGRKLARSTDTRIRVFSLTGEPKQIADVSMPSKTRASNIVWAGNDYLLVNRTCLIDIARGMIIWKYAGLDSRDVAALFPGDGKLWRVSTADQKIAVSAFLLPDERVKKTIAGLDMEQVMAIRPGEKVTLVIDIPDADLAASVKAHFESELKKNGMTEAEDQPIKLSVRMSTVGTETADYHSVRRPRGAAGSSVDVTKKQLAVAYEQDDQQLWSTVLYAGAPLMVSIKGGQTLTGAIAQRQAGVWSQIDSVELPKYVPAHRDEPGFGQTALGNETGE